MSCNPKEGLAQTICTDITQVRCMLSFQTQKAGYRPQARVQNTHGVQTHLRT